MLCYYFDLHVFADLTTAAMVTFRCKTLYDLSVYTDYGKSNGQYEFFSFYFDEWVESYCLRLLSRITFPECEFPIIITWVFNNDLCI